MVVIWQLCIVIFKPLVGRGLNFPPPLIHIKLIPIKLGITDQRANIPHYLNYVL
jgi:hypothetical protein